MDIYRGLKEDQDKYKDQRLHRICRPNEVSSTPSPCNTNVNAVWHIYLTPKSMKCEITLMCLKYPQAIHKMKTVVIYLLKGWLRAGRPRRSRDFSFRRNAQSLCVPRDHVSFYPMGTDGLGMCGTTNFLSHKSQWRSGTDTIILTRVQWVCAWLIRRVLDWMIKFIDTLYTALGTTDN
jgi:hypothetical protein